MEIKDLKANQGNVDIVAEVVAKSEPRGFEKFGKAGTVCNALLRDNSGEVKLTLWNEDIEKVNLGDKVHLEKGWCSEFKGEKQVSAGKFGTLEVISLEKSSEKKQFSSLGSENESSFSEDLSEDSLEDFTELVGEEESIE